MRSTSRRLAVAACAGLHVGVGLWLIGIRPWSAEGSDTATAGWIALVIATVVASLLDPKRSELEDPAGMGLSFMASLGALLFFGSVAMTLVATIGSLARAVRASRRTVTADRLALEAVTAIVATQAAGFVHAALGGTQIPLLWPMQGVPIAAAVATYCFVVAAGAAVIVPIATGLPVTRSWANRALRGGPSHFIGAGVSVALIETIQHREWGVLPVAALPLYLAWRAHIRHLDRLEQRRRRLEATNASDHGVCIVGESGNVTLWNDALARLLECLADAALGKTLGEALPALSESTLPATVRDCLATRSPRRLAQLELVSASGVRTLDVTILPDTEGAVLLWRDVTAARQTEQALQQNAERLAYAAERFVLIADGANDGLWELDERAQTLWVSARWNEIVGLEPGAGSGRSADWFDRVHPDDIAGLKRALSANGASASHRVRHEHRLRHEGGTYRRVLCSGVAAADAATRTLRFAGSLTDITETAMAQEQILNAGLSDSLTGLGNRAAFVEAVGQRLKEFQQPRGARFAVLYLDLDRFKVVNDSLGHMVGDELLVAVSRRLETCLRPGDVIARLGGDEFAVLLKGLDDEMQANVVAFRVQDALGKPFLIGDREVVTSASIGIAFSRVDYTHAEEVMRDADTAMYHAKSHGKARHELFDAKMHARAIDRLGFENDLRHAVRNRAFEVHYQPIVSLRTRMCIGFEALVRWTRNGKPVSPAEFIPAAEELGLIDQLGSWVLQEACRTFARWQRKYPASELECITVNVSTRQLVQQGFLYLVEQTVHATGLKPSDLRLEITETAVMEAPELAAQVLRELRAFGVKVYLDDFGTGHSSLSHLHNLQVDALKIDRSFVMGLLLDDRPAIVESILALAQTLQTDVVAEGVEDEAQAQTLERLGCRRAQGYLFSRPVPARAVEELLTAGQPLGARPATYTALLGHTSKKLNRAAS